MKEIKVFLVDDQEIFREGLARILQERSALRLVCQSGNNQAVLQRVRATAPDVLLIDPDITRPESVESLKKISQVSPGTHIVIFTDKWEPGNFMSTLRIGACSYLSKQVPVEDLVSSLSLIARGELVISPVFSRRFLFPTLSWSRSLPAAAPDHISGRETEVLTLVAGGATNKEIARQLCISENTVKGHLKNILEKLRLRNRQQLAAYAVRHGITMPAQ